MIIIGMDMALNNFALYTFFDNNHKLLVSQKYKTLSKMQMYDNVAFIHNSINAYLKIDNIIVWLLSFVDISDDIEFKMEGYSFGSISNRTLQTAEFMGVLKYRLKKVFPNSTITIVNPSTLKKKSTGYGNADKKMMYDAVDTDFKHFITNFIDVGRSLNINLKIENQPISDMVDAYHLYRFE